MDTSIEEIPFISVIVPIYNVERYVRKCLDSLKNQTMKQIEVICIDDGSTDESGHIADEYKDEEGWPRFRVIHTDNRGLSAARNRGIDEAKADWLMFVDSDDWVEDEFCRVPYTAAIENNADMVVFRAYDARENGVLYPEKSEAPVGLVNEFMAHEYGKNTVWRRLCISSLFENIRFPEGRVFEDIATTHKLIHKASRILLLNDHLYYHYYRKKSISNCLKDENKRDAIIAELERSIALMAYGYPKEKIRPSIYMSAIRYLVRTEPSSDKLYSEATNILTNYNWNLNRISLKQLFALSLWKKNKRLFFFICRVSGRMKTSANPDTISDKKNITIFPDQNDDKT